MANIEVQRSVVWAHGYLPMSVQPGSGADAGSAGLSLSPRTLDPCSFEKHVGQNQSWSKTPSRHHSIRPVGPYHRCFPFDRGSLLSPLEKRLDLLQARPEREMGDRHHEREQESERVPSVFDDISTLQRALEIARSTDQADLDPVLRDLLERALTELWDRIRANPTTYILTRDEFAVFNFYQHRWASDEKELGEAATARFWNAYRNRPTDSV
ncbi:MAG: hypothetical protein M1823_001307 [Watsoniomyces obsoletus]|nr:MAG: hypothetical protein M1823_001307 [Watsoniomyces obsoletus]